MKPPQVTGYKIQSLLARGGFSWVYRAVQTCDGCRVALKVGRPGTARRFAFEAEALRKVGAPIAPKLFSSGEASGRPWLALELLHGASLADRMASAPESGRFTLSQTSQWLTNLAPAVESVHRAGIIHRDLKPENIFLMQSGTFALLDFGLAREMGAKQDLDPPRLTQTGQPLGTPLYMAPEQAAASGDYGPEADVYSLGVIAFELLAGRPPFTGEAQEVLQAQLSLSPPRLGGWAPVPSAIEEVVHRCLEKEPTRRFRSARDFLHHWLRACASRKGRATSTSGRPSGVVSILSVESDLPLDQMLPSVLAEGGRLFRIESGRYLFSFPGKGALSATKRAAERLGSELEPSATVAVHPHHRGRAVTPLRRVRPEPPKHQVASSPPTPTELVGREALIQILLDEAEGAFADQFTSVTTLFGDVGLGKSRTLAELSQRLLQRGVHVVQVAASPSENRAPEETTRKLLEQLVGPPLARRSKWTGSAASDVAVALCLGLMREGNRAARRLQSVPGAIRQATAEALCTLLWSQGKRQPTALLLDDAQWADPTCLDALEKASMGEANTRLWICATALPAFKAIRPFWLDRARRCSNHELSPLNGAHSRALARQLLSPIEFIPERVLAFLEEHAQGSPLALEESVAALRRRGAIRQHADSGAWFVAVEEMGHRSDLPVYERIATEVLEQLTPRMRSFAQICATVGVQLPIEEVSRATRSLQRHQDHAFAGAWIDPQVGLSRLARAGLLIKQGSENFAFRHIRLKDAVEATASQLARETIHAELFRIWNHHPSRSANLPRLAEHASQCGARREAFSAYFEMAEASRLRHRDVEAVQQYSQALHQLERGEGRERYQALLGRGKARVRLQQFNEALEDLRLARALAETSAKASEGAEVLLEEATVLDWMEHWKASAQCVRRALKLLNGIADPALHLRSQLAVARGYVRRHQYRLACLALPKVLDRASQSGDYEVQAISLLLLSFAMVHVDTKQAMDRFEETISLCQSAGDAMHLGSAYLNRVMLWIRLRRADRALEDLRKANVQARWLGHPQLERFASYNLAECLFWQEQLEEARPFARRAFDLGVRFAAQHPSPLDALLLARIAHRSGDEEERNRWMQWIAQFCPEDAFDPNSRVLHRALQLLCGRKRRPSIEKRAWRALAKEGKVACAAEERRELATYLSAAGARIGTR